MATPIDDENGPLQHQLELLQSVELVSFTATPTALGPFGVSLLTWNVTGVKPAVRITLDGLQVPALSQRTVRPNSSHTYALSASIGPARKPLGTVVVHVDTSTCFETESDLVFKVMRDLLQAAIDDDPAAYWSSTDSSHLSVTEKDGRVHFNMIFRASVPGPDLWVTCRGSFGLRIEDGRIVAFSESVLGAAEFPKWWGFTLGFLGGLALAVNEANAKAEQLARDIVAQLTQLIDFTVPAKPGMTRRNVRVARTDGQPVIVIQQCSDHELQLFAQALAKASLTGTFLTPAPTDSGSNPSGTLG